MTTRICNSGGVSEGSPVRLRVRSFGMIQNRISNLTKISWITVHQWSATSESLLRVDSRIPLMHSDSSDLRSLIQLQTKGMHPKIPSRGEKKYSNSLHALESGMNSGLWATSSACACFTLYMLDQYSLFHLCLSMPHLFLLSLQIHHSFHQNLHLDPSQENLPTNYSV